ncbi:EAL domain-containing protein [Sphingomonas sp. CROZ-RG-20F-R02-07]|uniref:putative bifunctional diguanylate cyclase/phosphodiesterase n=1 Tax=Sphingomonas sp. CROZ-RG-20F-R02-07 TaxID=2914832 RepID=UPI001F587793|nr:EAL domain-containing protein [Sphingomonas sp. CROZ-RG-20F-R02-07]
MMRITLCIAQEHDLRLVALALVVCLIGSAASVQLFGRIRSASGHSRTGWIGLTAVATGTMVWATHFVAMMAFRTTAPVVLDPMLTLASLLVAIVVAAPGLAVAARRRPSAGTLGGGIIGLAVAIMHYLGMSAYRVDGIVSWRWGYVAASIVLSVVLSAAAFRVLNSQHRRRRSAAVSLLALAVAALHFTGMAAMDITVLRMGDGLSDGTMAALAFTTTIGALIVVGCAAISALIDGHTQGESYRRLRRMALHDGLTDLPNRMSFTEELERRFLVKEGYPCMAVAMLDLSRFKVVNDTYGHQAGDQLLIALAARLSAMLRSGECIARLGGDEFAAVISFNQRSELDGFLARLRDAFEQPFVFDRFTAAIGANIGVAMAAYDGFNPDELLAKADLAMYRAKSARSAEPCFYDAQMDDAVRERRELVADLREALLTDAFELHYQVQASIETGAITGYEALVRWNHPAKGLIPPASFIPLAEESGEIVPLSIWILRQACFEAALWPNRHAVSVNLSPKHLADPRLIETVRSALADSGLAPERLTLELTESAIIHDRLFALEQLRALKTMGLAIALDDFGVGYSSLDVLRSFPFDRIKLDASFVAEIERDEQAVSILRSVAALGVTLNMPVLAEGIEQPAQLAIVSREGCSAIQGYLIGRPSRKLVSADQVRRIMLLKPQAVESGSAVG